MFGKADLLRDIASTGLKPDDTVIIHSSMKAIGDVDGGAETVLDAFIEYLRPGLLLFPTHTWKTVTRESPVFNMETEAPCVGVLPSLFLRREGVVRSSHPTHSVAAIGKDAAEFVAGEEQFDTPCAKGSVLWKLMERGGKILFLGCPLSKNTFIHGVEEWCGIESRLSQDRAPFVVVFPDGRRIDRPCFTHMSPVPDISVNYAKLEEPFLRMGAAGAGQIGNARAVLCDARKMFEVTRGFLSRNHDLFIDDAPVPVEWYS
ncbi:MAG TPA: AAC(3) family N-acetyltransferase [Spirochaetota bacterium]|nr:AAC(3) family N-acetyltransferase [Spirochaetota bacterium]